MPETLAVNAVVALLGAEARRFDIDILDECGSSNSELLARAERGAPSGTVIAALRQTAGRGRRGRHWVAAPGDSLAFSLLWRFSPGTAPAGLSLAIGLAVVRAVAKVSPGATASLRLKWPNDVLLNDRKLGGILVELVPGSTHAAVIGIGLNLRLPDAMPAEVKAIAAALDGDVDPNCMLAALLSELRAVLDAFAAGGFAALRDAWLSHHAHQNASVTLLSDFGPPRTGCCRGVDVDGALLLEVDGRIERILSGEVSLRAQP